MAMGVALDVPTVLTDGGEDHASDPVLKRLGLGLVRAEDQLVEAGLGDGPDGTASFIQTNRGSTSDNLLAVVQWIEDTTPLSEAQRHIDIIGDEPGLSPDVDHADVVGVPVVPEGGRLEGGQSVYMPSEGRQTRLGVARYIPAASSLTDSCGPLRRSVSLSSEHQHSGDDEEDDMTRNRP